MSKLSRLAMLNKEIWSKEKNVHCSKNKIFIVSETEIDNLFMNFKKGVIAKGFQKKCGCEIVQLIGKKEQVIYNTLIESFGIRIEKVYKLDTIGKIIEWLSMFKTYVFFLFNKSGQDLVNYKIESLPIGYALYDKIIRTQDRNTIDNLDIKKDFMDIYEGILLYYNLKRIFRKEHPKYLLMMERCYQYYIYKLLALKNGAKVIRCHDIIAIDQYASLAENEREIAKKGYKEIDNAYINKYINSYFNTYRKGKSDLSWVNYGNSDKKDIELEEAVSKLNIDRNKKCVFIMAHVLSDAPHINSGMLYKDYYTALKETIKIASEIKSVNWILKMHPEYKGFPGASGEELAYEFGCNNISVLDKNLSNSIVFKLADAIITVQGTIGIEASARGIPVIITGKAWYADIGFTINAYTKEKYKYLLNNLYRIKPLRKDKVMLAKKWLYSYLMGYKMLQASDDDFSKGIYDILDKENIIERQNNIILNYLSDYMDKNDIRDVNIYKAALRLSKGDIENGNIR